MDFETVDILYRSRQTLLSILKAKGYNTKPYEKFGPYEIECMVDGDKEVSLRMDLERKLPEGSTAPAFCRVEYALPRVKNRLGGFLTKLTETEDGEHAIDAATTEVIVITLEAIGDTFHTAALNLFTTKSLRICFYDAHTLLSNPIEHVLVPLHEYVPPEEHAELLKKHSIKSKLNLPMIRFHQDIIGRILGIVPGDIVKITRASPSAGEYIFYRVCVP